jgi:phthiodiolone/phenolphthiodiolone dimycocerosates ketoreductase
MPGEEMMMEIEFGAPGQITPPVDRGVKAAVRMEQAGYDAVWWPDHLMGWHPDSIWTEDVTPLANYQQSSHVYVDPFVMMGAVGAQTESIRVGTCVTDLLRRHPAAIAQTMLTLDHLTQGRAILGVGTGEQLNIEPYGIEWSKPVGKLSEGLDVIRLLMQAGSDAVDYEGEHYHLKDAVMGLDPWGDRLPEIWLAAHGPRMLRLTGEKADGWLPTKMSPEQYRSSLDSIHAGARGVGRNIDHFTPGMLAYILVGPDEESVQRLLAAPLVRMLCILLPNRVFEMLGVDPPLGGGEEGSGFHDFIPTRVDRAEAERIIDAIPPRVSEYYAFAGTVEQLAEQITDYQKAGLRHLVMWNITGLGDPSLAKFSFEAMNQLKDMLRSA